MIGLSGLMKVISVHYAIHIIILKQLEKEESVKVTPFSYKGACVKSADNRCLLILVQITIVKRHKGNYK